MLKNKRFLSVLAGVFLLAISVSPVFAAAPLPVHIEVNETFGIPSPDPFTASGAAVDNGLICGSGMVEDVAVTSNNSSGPFQIIKVLKRFDCGDESGTFDIKMVVKLNKNTKNTTAKWRILGGTGGYAGLKGHGSLIGISNDPAPGIFDIYDGVVK
jgi:hypothetical protein